MKISFFRPGTVVLFLSYVVFAQPPVASKEPVPLRSKIIAKSGSVQLWSKAVSSMSTLNGAADLKSGTTLFVEKDGMLHLTFEPFIEMILTGPATFGFDNLLIDRSNGTIRLLCTMEKGTMSLKAPPQAGHTVLFSLKTPSATLDASTIDMTVSVDIGGVTTTDVRRGSTKIQPGAGLLKTTLTAGSRGTAGRNMTQLAISAIPDSVKFARAAAAEKKQPSIGILSIKSAKRNDESLEPISNAVATVFEKNTSAKVLFLDDIRKLLHSEGDEKLLTCFTDSCISKIGAGAGVDIVIVGNLAQLGSTYVLDLRMIDVLRDRQLSRTSISVTDDLGKILGEIPGAIGKLTVADTLLTSVVNHPVIDTTTFKAKYQELVVWIFPGKFTMGSISANGEIDELPTHEVELNGFFIDRFEVTRSEFEKQMGYNPVPARGCENCPVTNVTWQEASDYCRKMGKRLPTEAEWEYAARAGTRSLYYSGVALSEVQANFDAQKPFTGSPVGRFIGKVLPAGNYPPNQWNLHDMYGNVAEWCSDWYDIAYYGNSPQKNPTGPEKGTLKVVRGGSWSSAGFDVRSANRIAYNPTLRLNTIGFRCVKSDDSTSSGR